jgi:hypothetical protein
VCDASAARSATAPVGLHAFCARKKCGPTARNSAMCAHGSGSASRGRDRHARRQPPPLPLPSPASLQQRLREVERRVADESAINASGRARESVLQGLCLTWEAIELLAAGAAGAAAAAPQAPGGGVGGAAEAEGASAAAAAALARLDRYAVQVQAGLTASSAAAAAAAAAGGGSAADGGGSAPAAAAAAAAVAAAAAAAGPRPAAAGGLQGAWRRAALEYAPGGGAVGLRPSEYISRRACWGPRRTGSSGARQPRARQVGWVGREGSRQRGGRPEPTRAEGRLAARLPRRASEPPRPPARAAPRSMLEGRGEFPDADPFLAFWRGCVSRLSLLLYQVEGGQPVRGEMIQARLPRVFPAARRPPGPAAGLNRGRAREEGNRHTRHTRTLWPHALPRTHVLCARARSSSGA